MTLSPMNKMPEGWKPCKGAVTAPSGYYWANNGKSLFSPEYRQALIETKQD